MLHSFFIWQLPDVQNFILKSHLINMVGNCKIDIFSPGRTGRVYNRGCCKITLAYEQAVALNLFYLNPFDIMTLNLGLSGLRVLIKRWRKNDFIDPHRKRNFDTGIENIAESYSPSLIFDEFDEKSESEDLSINNDKKWDDIDVEVKFYPTYSDIVVLDSLE